MADIDLNTLEQTYIVVRARGVRRLPDPEVLRVLDDEVDAGVRALYDQERETIVAFLFTRGTFTPESAAQWVAEVEREGVNLSVPVGYRPARSRFRLGSSATEFLRRLGQRRQPAPEVAAAIDDMTFDQVAEQLYIVLDQGVDMGEDVGIRYPWLIDIYPDYVVFAWQGDYYRANYSADSEGKIAIGEPVKVRRQYVPVGEAASLAADAGRRRPVVFSLHLADPPRGFHADIDDDNLIWKEILRVSTTFRPATGDPFVVQQDLVDGIYQSFQAHVLDQVPITASTHYTEYDGIVPADDTRGFVAAMVKEGDRLFAGLDVRDDAVRAGILETQTIRDCSIYAWADFHDQRTNKCWAWVLVHLLLTNYAQVLDMEPFGVRPPSLAASFGEGAEYTYYTEEHLMNDETRQETQEETIAAALNEQDRSDLETLHALRQEGLSIASIAEQSRALRQQARELEVRQIVAALERNVQRADVVQVEGYRHYPSVVAAVERILTQNEQIAASITQEGRSPLDQAVLSVVNALPAEARMKISQPAMPDRAPKTPEERSDGGDETEEPTPEQIEHLAAELDLH